MRQYVQKLMYDSLSILYKCQKSASCRSSMSSLTSKRSLSTVLDYFPCFCIVNCYFLSAVVSVDKCCCCSKNSTEAEKVAGTILGKERKGNLRLITIKKRQKEALHRCFGIINESVSTTTFQDGWMV